MGVYYHDHQGSASEIEPLNRRTEIAAVMRLTAATRAVAGFLTVSFGGGYGENVDS